jgi:uncharacterized caspase-like protein
MVMPAFHTFPNEAAIIGRLLAGYAELEIDPLHCVSVARDDFDAVDGAKKLRLVVLDACR